MRPFQAVSFSILIHSLIVNAHSASNLRRSNDIVDPRLHHKHHKGHLSDGRIKFAQEFNDGIHLEVDPSCGVISSHSWISEVNAGIDWQKMETVVAFGDSYTQVGNSGDGSAPTPLRFVGKNPSAGGRNTNGETWIEQLVYYEASEDRPRKLLSYAQSGATTDKEIWPSRRWADDFPSQLSRFYANNTELKLDPATTVYVGYFGINDFWSIGTDGNNMERAGRRAASLIQDLHENAGAVNFLWIGVQFAKTTAGDYNRALWNGLRDLHQTTKDLGEDKAVKFAYADAGRFFSAIHEWYPKFGYTSSKHCLEGQRASIEDECEEPEKTVYYMGAHPSRQTHRILAEYVASVLTKCRIREEKQSYDSLSYHGSSLNGYLPSYLTSGHLYIFAFLVLSFCAYRPIMRLSRRGAFGGPITLMSPRRY
ncbi:carbohydrate esterase family 16 protein [Serendipita vermifera MAFF 305830]|uniref:Carbohydrate esterase family 16 protein n=1 Tax=Serendipita vermifera MAFF 305830 TaxID=933852 RepID=A0A0C3BKL2_SERVB|nr:carbohydrate esterase family 16 protein [Serendipita vermifera MAFF 305830]